VPLQRGALPSAQRDTHSRQTFWSGSYALHSQVGTQRVIPGFSALNGESGALALQTPTLGDAGFPSIRLKLRLVGAGATLSIPTSKITAYSQVLSGVPPNANSGRRRIPIHTSQTPTFGSGGYAPCSQIEIHSIFPRFSALNGESGALALQTPTLGEAISISALKLKLFGVGATLPVSKWKFIAYSQVLRR
jgi:hypothetical protein